MPPIRVHSRTVARRGQVRSTPILLGAPTPAWPTTRPSGLVVQPTGVRLSDEEWRKLASDLRLSDRESVVVRLLLDDFDDHRIADRLGISARTVRAYFERVYLRLDVHSRFQLLLRIFTAHLERCRRSPGS